MHFTYNETIASKLSPRKIQWFEVGSCHHWRKGLHANLVFYYDFQVLRSMQITQLLSSTWGQSRQIDLSLKNQNKNETWILMKWPAIKNWDFFLNCQKLNFFYEPNSSSFSFHLVKKVVKPSGLIIIISICGRVLSIRFFFEFRRPASVCRPCVFFPRIYSSTE